MLVAAQAELARCTPLYDDPAFEPQRSQLAALVASKWPAL